MFGIDFSEILVIFAIALVVLGPEKLPKLAATVGRWIGRARAMARQFREQLEQEANSLNHGVDLGPEFGRGTMRPKTPNSSGPTASDSAPGDAGPATGVPATPSEAHPVRRSVPAATVVEAVVVTAASDAAGIAPTEPAMTSAPQGELPAELTLADTHPAGLHPLPTGSPVSSVAPTPRDAGVSGAASHFQEPHQGTFWPPDGAL
jgi:Tat protein translocase TatB subunit